MALKIGFRRSYFDLTPPTFGVMPEHAQMRHVDRFIVAVMTENMQAVATALPMLAIVANVYATELLEQSGLSLEAERLTRGPLDDAAYRAIVLAEVEVHQKATRPGKIDITMASIYTSMRQEAVEKAESRGEWAGYLFDLAHYNHRMGEDLGPSAPPLP